MKHCFVKEQVKNFSNGGHPSAIGCPEALK